MTEIQKREALIVCLRVVVLTTCYEIDDLIKGFPRNEANEHLQGVANKYIALLKDGDGENCTADELNQLAGCVAACGLQDVIDIVNSHPVPRLIVPFVE